MMSSSLASRILSSSVVNIKPAYKTLSFLHATTFPKTIPNAAVSKRVFTTGGRGAGLTKIFYPQERLVTTGPEDTENDEGFGRDTSRMIPRSRRNLLEREDLRNLFEVGLLQLSSGDIWPDDRQIREEAGKQQLRWEREEHERQVELERERHWQRQKKDSESKHSSTESTDPGRADGSSAATASGHIGDTSIDNASSRVPDQTARNPFFEGLSDTTPESSDTSSLWNPSLDPSWGSSLSSWKSTDGAYPGVLNNSKRKREDREADEDSDLDPTFSEPPAKKQRLDVRSNGADPENNTTPSIINNNNHNDITNEEDDTDDEDDEDDEDAGSGSDWF